MAGSARAAPRRTRDPARRSREGVGARRCEGGRVVGSVDDLVARMGSVVVGPTSDEQHVGPRDRGDTVLAVDHERSRAPRVGFGLVRGCRRAGDGSARWMDRQREGRPTRSLGPRRIAFLQVGSRVDSDRDRHRNTQFFPARREAGRLLERVIRSRAGPEDLLVPRHPRCWEPSIISTFGTSSRRHGRSANRPERSSCSAGPSVSR